MSPCLTPTPAGRRRSRGRGRQALVRFGAALAAGSALAGCASAVEVPVAPFADDPLCARVILALPQVLADAERVDTTSQGTAAWSTGGSQSAIVLRCGVEPLPPTTEQCVTVADDRGRSVDWVVVPGEEGAGTPWTFTTYGRLPAVRVSVPTSVPAQRAQSVLVDLAAAASQTEQSRECL